MNRDLDGPQRRPLISCVMPTYGRPLYVNEAVAMFLRQDYPDRELIVLNDCPGQTYVCDLPQVRVVNRPERYPTLGEKRNGAIELARGELIAVWDDDDVYLPWRLSYSLAAMTREGREFYRAAEFWAYWGEEALHDNQSVPGWVNHPNTLFTRSLWEQVGGYPAQGVGEDSVFFERIHRHLGEEFLKTPLDPVDRFFVLRGASHYHHMSMNGGQHPLDTSPGEHRIVPTAIGDPLLRRICDDLEHRRSVAADAPP